MKTAKIADMVNWVLKNPIPFLISVKRRRRKETFSELKGLTANGSRNYAVTVAKISGDLCKVQDTCPQGYTCTKNTCYHLCENLDCGTHGVCTVVVNTRGMASSSCV